MFRQVQAQIRYLGFSSPLKVCSPQMASGYGAVSSLWGLTGRQRGPLCPSLPPLTSTRCLSARWRHLGSEGCRCSDGGHTTCPCLGPDLPLGEARRPQPSPGPGPHTLLRAWDVVGRVVASLSPRLPGRIRERSRAAASPSPHPLCPSPSSPRGVFTPLPLRSLTAGTVCPCPSLGLFPSHSWRAAPHTPLWGDIP